MLVLAAGILSCGMCAALFYLFSPLTSAAARNDLATNTFWGSAAGLGVVFGAALTWQAVNLLRGHESRSPAQIFPRAIFFVAAFLIVIPLGLLAQNVPVIAAYVFPPWHFLAALIPPLGVLAFAARRLGETSGLRALLTALTWGAFGATPIAIVMELASGALLLLVATIVIALSPNSQRLLDQMQSMLSQSSGMLDLQAVTGLMTNPAVTIGVLVYFAGIVPLIEETLKTFVLAFIDPKRTQLQDAVLWGIAAGAGFAMIENNFNTTSVLSLWAITLFTRLGATTMHVANGVTMGRGWHAARVEGRWSKLFSAFLTSVFFHALWNGLAIALSASALYLSSNPKVGWPSLAPAGVLMVAIAAALIVLAILGAVWIAYSVRQARAPAQNLLKGEILS